MSAAIDQTTVADNRNHQTNNVRKKRPRCSFLANAHCNRVSVMVSAAAFAGISHILLISRGGGNIFAVAALPERCPWNHRGSGVSAAVQKRCLCRGSGPLPSMLGFLQHMGRSKGCFSTRNRLTYHSNVLGT